MELLPVLLFAIAAIAAAVCRRHASRDALQASFDALVFQTEAGPVPGKQLKVVRTVLDSIGNDDGNTMTAFWYCVGAGPTYFVAIAQRAAPGWRGRKYQWVVRPLSEERMRGALAADTEALCAAFGDRTGGTLHA